MTSLTSTCTVYLSVWGLEKTRPSMCALFSLFVQLQIQINHVTSPFTFAPFVLFSRRRAAEERSANPCVFGQILKQHWATTMSFLCNASFPEDQQLARRPSIHYFQVRNPRFLLPLNVSASNPPSFLCLCVAVTV